MGLVTCCLYWWTSEDRACPQEQQSSSGKQRMSVAKAENWRWSWSPGWVPQQASQTSGWLVTPTIAGTLFQWTEELEILVTSLWPSLPGPCLPFPLSSMPFLFPGQSSFCHPFKHSIDTWHYRKLWAQRCLQQPGLSALLSCHGSWLYLHFFCPFP